MRAFLHALGSGPKRQCTRRTFLRRAGPLPQAAGGGDPLVTRLALALFLLLLLPPPAFAQMTGRESPRPRDAPWRCGEKTYCRQMTSCAEAMFHYRNCGLLRLDGDRDGVPCEALCGGSRRSIRRR
jgi:hypothetical protein